MQLGLNTACGSHSHSGLSTAQILETPVALDMVIVPLACYLVCPTPSLTVSYGGSDGGFCCDTTVLIGNCAYSRIL